MLHLSDHLLTPDFSAYQHTALASPYPHNGVVADLAHAQGALVGYVHPFDWDIDPPKEKALSNALPADVAAGKIDYIEIVGFSDHKATANVWYRLLNLGFRLPAGAGTDAMANYASLRGPVGMNRVFLETGGETAPLAARDALKAGRSFSSNGPLLGLELAGKRPGDTVARPARGKIPYRIALRSPVAVDHLELVRNGQVVKGFRLSATAARSTPRASWRWIPAAGCCCAPGTTAPTRRCSTFILTPRPARSISTFPAGHLPRRKDAAYFAAWMERVVEAAAARGDYNTPRERQETLAYLHDARARFAARATRR